MCSITPGGLAGACCSSSSRGSCCRQCPPQQHPRLDVPSRHLPESSARQGQLPAPGTPTAATAERRARQHAAAEAAGAAGAQPSGADAAATVGSADPGKPMRHASKPSARLHKTLTRAPVFTVEHRLWLARMHNQHAHRHACSHAHEMAGRQGAHARAQCRMLRAPHQTPRWALLPLQPRPSTSTCPPLPALPPSGQVCVQRSAVF